MLLGAAPFCSIDHPLSEKIEMYFVIKKLLLVLLSLQLLACGGGGGGDSSNSVGDQGSVTVNLPPTAQAQNLQAQSGRTLTGQLKGIDPEQIPLKFSLVSGPAFGRLQLGNDGQFTLDVPAIPVATELQFSFLVDDGQHQSEAALVKVEIMAPTGTMVPIASQFQAVKGKIFQGQLKFLNATTEQASIVIWKKPVVGQLDVKPDGSFSYIAAKNSTAQQDSFEFYVVSSQTSSTTAKVEITLLEGSNVAPQIAAQSFSLAKGSTLRGQLQATDADTDPLTFRLVQQPAAGSLELQDDGRFVLNVERNITVDQLRFEVAVTDGLLSASAVITMNLTPYINTAPMAQSQILDVAVDHLLLGSLLAADMDGDALQYELVQAPAAGELLLQQNGQFRFISPINSGTQTFSFRAFDGELYSQPAAMTVHVNATKAELRQSSYLKYARWGQPVSGVIYQSAELVAGGQLRAQQLEVMAPARFGKVTVADGVFVYTPTAEQTAPTTDRFVLQQQLPDGTFALVRIELDFSHPAFLDHQPDSKAALAPEWQSAADFPASLAPILQGLNPFTEIADFSEQTKLDALKALDVLIRKNNATDQQIGQLAYYLRAAYFHTLDHGDAQWHTMLETMLYGLSRMDGFFSNSTAGLQLQSALFDSGYVLQYFKSRPDRMIKLVESSRLVLQQMLRQPFEQADYQWKLTFSDQMNMQDRLLYGIYLTENTRIDERLSQQLQQLQQQFAQHLPLLDVNDSNHSWILNFQLLMAKSLWFASDTTQHEAVVANTAALIRAGVGGVDEQQLERIKLYFYKDFVVNTLGRQDPELAKSRCNNEFADICREVSIAQVLPNQLTCPQTVTFVYDQITAPQLTQLCSALESTATRFHDWMQTANQPLPGDLNASLEAVVFNSSQHYQDYAGVLFDVDTNNGGIYLEGNPTAAENQARYLAYQRVVNDRWWVWNLEHEFVHYLEGRFIAAGDYSTSSQVAGVWWGEGLAEWVAWGEEFPRGFAVFLKTAAAERPDLATIFKATYANLDLAYHWSYSVHYFLNTQQRASHLQLAACLKKADQACVSKLEQQIIANFGGEYAQFMSDLVARLDTPKGWQRYHPSLFRDQYPLLQQHSQQHSQPQLRHSSVSEQAVQKSAAQPAAASAGPRPALHSRH